MNKKLIKILNHLLINELDPEEISEVYEYLKDELGFSDNDSITKIMLLYRKYSPMLEDGEDFSSIGNMNIDYNPDDIEGNVLALAKHLDTHPFLLKRVGGYYYEYSLDESEYLVGNEEEIREIFDDRVEDEIENIKEWNLEFAKDFAKLDMGYVEFFAEEEAEYFYREEEPEEVIKYLGYESELESRLSKLEEVESEMDDVDNMIGDLDYDIENETGEFTVEELEEMEDRRDLLKQKYEVLENFVDNFDEDKIKEDLVEELGDKYIETRTNEIIDNIENDPISYFKDFGMSEKHILDNYFVIDEDEMAEAIWRDKEHMLASYDGWGYSEYVNGEWYYIYRTN